MFLNGTSKYNTTTAVTAIRFVPVTSGAATTITSGNFKLYGIR
jgi:hypothetical protein